MISKKKTLIYTTFSQKEYATIASRLHAHGIKFRVAMLNNMSEAAGGAYDDYKNEYKLYVTKQNKENARRAIHTTA
ncbi:hypothetical protein ACFFGV_04910 [Pontibacillus salicampi]|uniref:DUF2007 domain-containing protein n=1 Tax=Pontibacillus salicampi TaxID=1449801 RepID=A0ABV6LKP5_9BACI